MHTILSFLGHTLIPIMHLQASHLSFSRIKKTQKTKTKTNKKEESLYTCGVLLFVCSLFFPSHTREPLSARFSLLEARRDARRRGGARGYSGLRAAPDPGLSLVKEQRCFQPRCGV